MDLGLLGFTGLRQVYNVHPAFVHFPIALFPIAFWFYFLGVLRHSPALAEAGRASLYLAAASALVAVLTGLRAEDSFPHNEVIHRMMETHETIGYVILGLAAVLTGWSFWRKEARPKAVWLFLATLGLAAVLALQNGDLGGRMVFLEGAAVKAPPRPAAPPAHSHPPGSPPHRH